MSGARVEATLDARGERRAHGVTYGLFIGPGRPSFSARIRRSLLFDEAVVVTLDLFFVMLL